MSSGEFDWLQVHVAMADDADDFVLTVTFQNCSKTKQSVYWTFKNVLGKAESVSLQLISKRLGRLRPAEFMSGVPVEREHAEFRFGEKQFYVIRGKIDRGNLLRLGGASYFVEPGEEYEVSFQYSTARSNIILWRAPART